MLRSLSAALALAGSLVLLPGPACAGPVWHSFGGDKAEVLLPADFSVRRDERGGLAARFGPGGANVLEVSLQDYQAAAQGRDAAERFLRVYAQQKKLPLKAERGKLMMIEPAPDLKQGGIVLRRTHWRVAFGQSLVVLTLTAPIGQQLQTAVLDFLRGPLKETLASLRVRSAAQG